MGDILYTQSYIGIQNAGLRLVVRPGVRENYDDTHLHFREGLCRRDKNWDHKAYLMRYVVQLPNK